MRQAVFPPNRALRLVLAWLLPVIVCWLQWVYWQELAPFAWFLFYPVIFYAPYLGGRAGGVGATFISAALVWYFFLPPQLSWEFTTAGVPLSVLIFVNAGLIFTIFHQRLRTSEVKYRTLFDKAADGIAVLDAEGRFLDVNPAYIALIDRPRTTIMGARVEEFVSDHTIEQWQKTDAALQIDGNATFERQVQRPDGTLVPIEVRVTPLIGGERLAVVRNIAKRRRLEEALRQSERKFALFFQAAPFPLAVVELESGRYLDVNDEFVRCFGYERDVLIGRTSAELGMFTAAMRRAKIDDLQRTGSLQSSQIQITCQSGVVKECLVSSEVLDLPWRQILLHSLADISDLVQAQQEVRTNEERFRLVFQNSPSGIAVWDGSGKLQYTNPAINGWFTANFANENNTSDSRLVAKAVAHCARHPGEKRRVDVSAAHPSGERRDLQITFQGFGRGSSESEVVSISHDVTEQRKAERVLQQANQLLEQQLHELQRTAAAKDAFMAAVSHELRTPLMGVLSMSELLQSEIRGPLTPDQARYVSAIHDSGKRLTQTINHVLLYTSLMAGARPLHSDHCDLSALLASVVRAVRHDAERKQQHLVLAVNPSGLNVQSDQQSIAEITEVLVANAIKFTPEHGSIIVQAAPAPAGAVEIIVSDTGIGMNEEQMADLFQPFTQGDQMLARRFEGLGLGLAYVHKMVELLGGSISVQSTAGAGSCFAVTLPPLPPSHCQPTAGSPASPISRFTSPTPSASSPASFANCSSICSK